MCYTELKAALLAAHQLTSFQKVGHLFSAELLGERRSLSFCQRC